MDCILTVKASHYIIAGVGIVAAMSWNTTIKNMIDTLYPMPDQHLIAAFVYSLTITMFLILLIYILPDTTTELPKHVKTYIKALKVNDLHKRIDKIQQETKLISMQRN